MAKTDIIIFSGQSNMQGETWDYPENEQITEGLYEYRFLKDEIVPLKNPVGEYILTDGTEGSDFTGEREEKRFAAYVNSIALGRACNGCINMVPAFCRRYKELTGKNVLAVSAAKGSTTISKFLKGHSENEFLFKKIKAALKKNPEYDKLYFVWLQGESDACAQTSQKDYERMITELKNDLKKEFNIDKFGIIRVGRFAGIVLNNDEGDEAVLKAQDCVCISDPDFVMLTREAAKLSLTEEYMNKNVPGHFNARGLETLGVLGAEALSKLQ